METYLALGDSYTIGEQVQLSECFPYQAVQLLRKIRNTITSLTNDLKEDNIDLQISAPEIIAKTGWTTDELLAAIQQTSFLQTYDYVSLLIGVNNQYRGRSVENFKMEFERLLQLSIQFAAGKRKNVFVLSIPDWGLTPFAEGRDRKKISSEIDAYNSVCKTLSQKNDCNFIDITTSQRSDATDENFLAADKLHPSGKEYAKWAKHLSEKIIELV